MKKFNYYQSELSQLEDNSGYFKTIIVSDGFGQSTKTLDLNKESIDVLVKWLKKERFKLSKLEYYK